VERDTGYGSYSRSALGTEALYEILKAHRPYVQRRLADTPLPRGPFSAVVLADPFGAWLASDGNLDALECGGRILAILPKWRADDDPFRKGWVRKASPLHPDATGIALAFLAGTEKGEAGEGPGIPETLTLDRAPSFNYNRLGIDPDFGERPVQLMGREGLKPIVSSREGVLVGELARPGAPLVWIVSDPDVTSNHGLVRGRNLRFALALFDLWTADLPRSAAVTFDESHLETRTGKGAGAGNTLPSLAELFRSPAAGPLLLAFLAAVLLALFGTRRFWPEARPPGPVFGKGGLIANTALLLERGPLLADLFARYADTALREAARSLKAPTAARNDRQRLVAWLDARAPDRAPWTLAKISAEARKELALPSPDPSRLLFLAGRLHLWKEEAESGFGTGGKDNRRGARRGL
jgi:hypothetical protein